MTEQQQARTSEEEAVVKVGGEGSPLQRQGSKSSREYHFVSFFPLFAFAKMLVVGEG